MASKIIYDAYLKKAINWKLFNYLIDSATEFEDFGCRVHIIAATLVISSDGFYDNHTELYSYRNGKTIQDRQAPEKRSEILKMIESTGVWFLLWVESKGDMTFEKYYNKVRNKFKETDTLSSRNPEAIVIAPDPIVKVNRDIPIKRTGSSLALVIGYGG